MAAPRPDIFVIRGGTLQDGSSFGIKGKCTLYQHYTAVGGVPYRGSLLVDDQAKMVDLQNAIGKVFRLDLETPLPNGMTSLRAVLVRSIDDPDDGLYELTITAMS